MRIVPFDKLARLGACRGAGCLALLALAFLGPPHAAAQRTPAFMIGVMRRDGVIIPFAAHDGKRWSNAWPGPRLDLQVPITLSSVPKAWWGPAKPAADCATYRLPLGALRLDARVFWLAQNSGWDRERYVVVEVKKDKVEAAISSWGGGCWWLVASLKSLVDAHF